MSYFKRNWRENKKKQVSYLLEKDSFEDLKRDLEFMPFGSMKSDIVNFVGSNEHEQFRVKLNERIHDNVGLEINSLMSAKELVDIDLKSKINDFESEVKTFITSIADLSISQMKSVSEIENTYSSIESEYLTNIEDLEFSLNTINLENLDFNDQHLIYHRSLALSNGIEESYDSWYRRFLIKLEAIIKAKKLLKALTRQVNFLLKLLNKRLRNLRKIFTKLHSFHFKNLDDYHSTNLNLSF